VKLIHLLCLVGALVVSVPYIHHESAHAAHLERGCKEAPARMEIPHRVQDFLCRPALGVYPSTSVTMRNRDGRVIDFVAMFESEEMKGNPEGWVATAVFEVKDGQRGRLLVFGTAEGWKYVARGVPEGLAL